MERYHSGLLKSVVCSCKQEAIKALKALHLNCCIRTKEDLDKENCLKLAESNENILLKAGITVKTEDKVKIEPDYSSIQE